MVRPPEATAASLSGPEALTTTMAMRMARFLSLLSAATIFLFSLEFVLAGDLTLSDRAWLRLQGKAVPSHSVAARWIRGGWRGPDL